MCSFRPERQGCTLIVRGLRKGRARVSKEIRVNHLSDLFPGLALGASGQFGAFLDGPLTIHVTGIPGASTSASVTVGDWSAVTDLSRVKERPDQVAAMARRATTRTERRIVWEHLGNGFCAHVLDQHGNELDRVIGDDPVEILLEVAPLLTPPGTKGL